MPDAEIDAPTRRRVLFDALDELADAQQRKDPLAVEDAAMWLAHYIDRLHFEATCGEHDDLTEQTLRGGMFVCVKCRTPIGIKQEPEIRDEPDHSYTRVTSPEGGTDA